MPMYLEFYNIPFKNGNIFSPLKKSIGLESADISENAIRQQMPEVLDILLIDRTTSTKKKTKNIIWANENYIKYGEKRYGAQSQIKPELITGGMGQLIEPRALKHKEVQKERTKSKAEVFTPTWVVKKQNDVIDAAYRDDDLETYVRRTWLEITCGEAPYMATRYDMQTGDIISLADRVGFVDRKLKRINNEIHDKEKWLLMTLDAFKASYGFEWNGDSLLLARENLLYTYQDYYFNKWHELPSPDEFKQIASIISYNLFQMDGLKYIIPLSDKPKKVAKQQLNLFNNNEPSTIVQKKVGKRVKIMNWATQKMEPFDKELE